ncbi:alpha/beta hydrolase [Rickettsiales endosymbiont of Stachyamoeba lipophora]|uniref:alpha/beta hydrolase n=1 Tax=Rickettsiales endosymbiont of Stachyamoeba lipophora TaxID=2486578 RepID=UPI000F64C6CE|nr:alpha/beta hydrolase [Rickettsiales endosymbiont of Stachyamoeba lipophora]AZL15211.1 alpha/beta hydrolase [Rickettsiales endosymbiont of Stachyamoeba lipophora]
MPEVILNGPEGRIEGRYTQGEERNAPAVLILHPHPLHGGTMNNKVVYNLYQTFVKSGFSALRINFRGVGKSSGTFDNGIGELADAAIALDWLQHQNQYANTFWIAGFSFGSWIALQLLMRRPELQGFIAISPPVNKYDFSFLSPCPASGLIVQGNNDSVVSEEAVSKMVNKLSKQKHVDVDYRVIINADHFFRNQLEEMNENVREYVVHRMLNDSTNIKTKPDKRRRKQQVE